MKRIFIIAFLAIFLFCGNVGADPFAIGSGEAPNILVYEVPNTGNSVLKTTFATTTIVPGTVRILGVAIMQEDTGGDVSDGAHAELWVSLRDTGANDGFGGTVAEVIAEAEVTDGQRGEMIWFMYPITINTQLEMVQGANTDVLLYYIN